MEAIKKIFSKYKFMLLALLALVIVALGITYAFVYVTKSGNSSNKLKVGNLSLNLDESTTAGITINPAYPMTNLEGVNDTPSYVFTLENNGNLSADYTIYLDDITTAAKKMDLKIIKFNLKKEMYNSSNGLKANQPADKLDLLSNIKSSSGIVLDTGTLEANEKNVYTLNVWMDYDAGNEYQGSSFNGQLRIEGTQQYTKVVNAFVYDQTNTATKCITGEESTCVKTECYKTKTANSCPAGTIIKYKVNNDTTETFHVMYDRANSITMQSQKNTVYNTAWVSKADYVSAGGTESDYGNYGNTNKGPLTILPALESATRDWTNVEDQTYTMGTTNFPIGDEGQFPSANSGTSCTQTSCSGNKYTLDSRTAKARMITVQETAMLGCTALDQSCPIWMNNYLYKSTNYGGTVDDNEIRNSNNNWGYWTMSANSSNADLTGTVFRSGHVGNNYTNDTHVGARAVVVINK